MTSLISRPRILSFAERQLDLAHRTAAGVLRWDRDGSIVEPWTIEDFFDAGLIEGDTAILTVDAYAATKELV